MHFAAPTITSLLLLLSPFLTNAKATPKAEPVHAAFGTAIGPAGPQSAKRQTTIYADPNYPINCTNSYCYPYNTLCDGSTCEKATMNNEAFANVKAGHELAMAFGIVGAVFAVL